MTDYLNETFRILDASANRTREGLRVIEDFARFVLDDAHLSRLLKERRHELAEIMAQLPESSLLSARDTLQDVGTTITTAAESHRSSAIDVVQAAFKRSQEAMRTLEEYGKVIAPSTAPRFEQLRYQLYSLEKAVLRTESASRRLDSQRLYVLVQSQQCSSNLESVVKSALDAGVRLIQLREKTLSDRDFVNLARRLRKWTASQEALLIINDRPDIAVVSEADGVHVGQDELTVHDARRVVGPNRIVGVSTHSIEQARAAVLDGADYLGVGPTFQSGTKSFSEFPGTHFVAQVAAEIRLPWYAIGGIDTSNIEEVVRAGATRVAVSGAICRTPSPAVAAKHLLDVLMKDHQSNRLG
ncbi:thiamine phosphate synthase [Schlesneria paludicola]|uniref:thiamine phosphate synthase n=1 Tax=Schlesneria paludicola TaxID=360056 RepID=UPI000299F8E4|nr:thiamine phosphate synthase [Schlesneria paludicola]